ncbi:malonic semialdehyde reductase [Nisaea sp.]|uniref:malonic semialdehyde reductase n=1 Tax=Nisaea sp. TaxID=2024842 RepID=UPI002B272933|nr:malonic semialdehyde reductase [Nisaea sp.]
MTNEIKAAQEEVAVLRSRISTLGADGIDLLFRKARSHNKWTDAPITDDQIRRLYELVRMGPTANNGCPARYLFIRTGENKAKLAECVAPGNKPKVLSAPVTAIIGYDTAYYENFDRLFPHKPEYKDMFASDPKKAEAAAFRNSSLQGAYLILAARALGLDTGPMSGFDNAAVDKAFFAETTIRSNFLCCLGTADLTGLFQRLPRLQFDEVCELL